MYGSFSYGSNSYGGGIAFQIIKIIDYYSLEIKDGRRDKSFINVDSREIKVGDRDECFINIGNRDNSVKEGSHLIKEG